MKRAALALARRGIAVFPCWENRKTPVCRHGFKEATTDPAIIEAWWSSYPTANIGVATGSASGIFVADIDEKHGRTGEADLRALEAKHGPLPKTVESITPSKGRHLWFRMPEHAVPSSVGKVAPNIDVRATGGYVLVPPSHVIEDYGAGDYSWSVDSGHEFADAPDWFLGLISHSGANISDLDARRSDDHWLQIVRNGAQEGARNSTTASLTGYLLRKGIDPLVALELVRGWNVARNIPPLPDAEVTGIVASITEREMKRRSII